MFEFQEKILLRFPDTRKTTISQMHAMIDPIVNPNKPEIEMRIQHSMPSVVEFWGQGQGQQSVLDKCIRLICLLKIDKTQIRVDWAGFGAWFICNLY